MSSYRGERGGWVGGGGERGRVRIGGGAGRAERGPE